MGPYPKWGIFFSIRYDSSLRFGDVLQARVRTLITQACPVLSDVSSTVYGSETESIVVFMNPDLSSVAALPLQASTDVSGWVNLMQSLWPTLRARRLLAASATVPTVKSYVFNYFGARLLTRHRDIEYHFSK